MKTEIRKFGELLISRPDGKEAYIVIKAYFTPSDPDELLELDFTGVSVVTPGWLDEVLTNLERDFGNRVVVLPSDNVSVKESLMFVRKISRESNAL